MLALGHFEIVMVHFYSKLISQQKYLACNCICYDLSLCFKSLTFGEKWNITYKMKVR